MIKRTTLQFAFFSLLIWALNPLWGASERSRLDEKSHLRAEALAYQLVQIYQHTNIQPANNQQRGIASEGSPDGGQPDGEMGKDPWGEPFQYKLSRNESGDLKAVRVWSKNMREPVFVNLK